jgi:hypothetical protein
LTSHDFLGKPLAVVFSVWGGSSQLQWLYCASPKQAVLYLALHLPAVWPLNQTLGKGIFMGKKQRNLVISHWLPSKRNNARRRLKIQGTMKTGKGGYVHFM